MDTIFRVTATILVLCLGAALLGAAGVYSRIGDRAEAVMRWAVPLVAYSSLLLFMLSSIWGAP